MSNYPKYKEELFVYDVINHYPVIRFVGIILQVKIYKI